MKRIVSSIHIDEIASFVFGLGGPCLTYFTTKRTSGLSGAASCTQALKAIGGSIDGGVLTLGTIGWASERVGKSVVETLAIKHVDRQLSKGREQYDLLTAISEYPLSNGLKERLEALVMADAAAGHFAELPEPQ